MRWLDPARGSALETSKDQSAVPWPSPGQLICHPVMAIRAGLRPALDPQCHLDPIPWVCTQGLASLGRPCWGLPFTQDASPCTLGPPVRMPRGWGPGGDAVRPQWPPPGGRSVLCLHWCLHALLAGLSLGAWRKGMGKWEKLRLFVSKGNEHDRLHFNRLHFTL